VRGPAGIGVIKSLRKSNYKGKIVSWDSSELATGLYLSDSYHIVPRLGDPNQWKIMKDIIIKEKIDLIYPSSGFDIITISKHVEELKELNVELYMSTFDKLNICMDKLLFYEALKENFNMPKTSLKEKDISFPKFAKPRRGKGSVGIKLCNTQEDINSLDKSKEYIFQEYLPGKEITIDVLTDTQGKGLFGVMRERIETKAGISTKGTIFLDENLEREAIFIVEHLGLIGPQCLQFMYDTNNIPRPLELNPRLGGGTYFATLAGVNIPQLMIDLKEQKQPTITKPKEITILRYFEEIIQPGE